MREAPYTTRLGGTYGLRLSLRSDERADLGLFFDLQAREEMRFYFEDFVQTHLERHTSETVQRRRCFACPKCGKVFPETDVIYRQPRGFTFIKCICDMEVSLLNGEKRLAALSALQIRKDQTSRSNKKDVQTSLLWSAVGDPPLAANWNQIRSELLRWYEVLSKIQMEYALPSEM